MGRHETGTSVEEGSLPLVAGLVGAAIVVLFVLPGPRHAVARWLGFDSVRIEPGVTVPTTATATVPTGSTDAASAVTTTAVVTTVEPQIDLGPAVSISEAMHEVTRVAAVG